MPDLATIRDYLAPHGIAVLEFAQPTPTAELAAQAIGCSVGEIAKTILFIVGGRPLVVIAPGDRKVSSSLLKQAAGLTGKVRLPAADEVFALTGYRPGGVAPFLLPAELPVLLDAGLRRFAVIYPAAGNDRSGVPLSCAQLLALTGAREVLVCPPSPAAA